MGRVKELDEFCQNLMESFPLARSARTTLLDTVNAD